MASGSATANKIERAHQMYREGKYRDALDYYTDALSMAKTKPQRIALHSNRAACYLKLHDFSKAAEECTSVLELDYDHTGALMLRAQTLVTLKEYHSALFDVSRLIDLNPSSEVYRNLQTRLKTQLSLAPIPEEETESEEEEEEDHYTDEAKLEENEKKQEDSYNNAEGFESRENDASESQNIVPITENVASQNQTNPKTTDDQQTTGWKTIPKPKGHSNLDYSRWDRVENDSSDEDDDEDDDDSDDDNSSRPQYRFRVKTVGVRAVK
ncbi:hypothetical protein ACP275_08G166900 [Erythranthe tilingii]